MLLGDFEYSSDFQYVFKNIKIRGATVGQGSSVGGQLYPPVDLPLS